VLYYEDLSCIQFNKKSKNVVILKAEIGFHPKKKKVCSPSNIMPLETLRSKSAGER
jgi:hypothetical protein